jgi:hypothetical protein
MCEDRWLWGRRKGGGSAMKNTLALSGAAVLGFTILNGPANAAVTIDISQVGTDTVVETGKGTIESPIEHQQTIR